MHRIFRFVGVGAFLLWFTLSAVAAPSPTTNPATRSAHYLCSVGERLELGASPHTATGKLSYRWFRDGRPLSGLKTSRIKFASVSVRHHGVYTVEITDSADGGKATENFYVSVAPKHGHMAAFGDNTHGQGSVPSALLPPVRIDGIAAGETHSVALSAGRIIAWGDNSAGQTATPPLGGKHAHAVAAGGKHSLALLTDGTVVAWGDNSSGQCEVPSSIGSVRAIAAGGSHSLALRNDNVVLAWGENASGQLDAPAVSSPIVSLAAGHDHSLALLANGQVVAWGADDHGQCSVPAGLHNVASVGAAGDTSFAVTRTGKVHVWGDTSFGQSPAPAKLKPIASLTGGWDFIAAQLKTGSLAFWGQGASPFATESQGLGKIYALAAGSGHVLALRNGAADTKPRILIPPAGAPSTTWDQPVELSVSAKGPLLAYQWYRNGSPIPGATGATYRIDAVRLGDVGTYSVRVFNGFNYVDVQNIQVARPGMPALVAQLLTSKRQVVPIGGRLRIELSSQGAGDVSYTWLRNGETIPGQHSAVLDIPVNDETAGGTYIAQISDEGQQYTYRPSFIIVPPAKPTRIIAWGDNSLGQTNVPYGLQDVIKLVSGPAHTLALRADGTVAAWGDNRRGQCTIPDGLTEVVDIAASEFYSAALKADGSIVAWGGGRDPVIHPTSDPQINSIQVYSRGVHAYTTPARQRILSELPNFGGIIDYSLGGNGDVHGWVSSYYPELPLPEPAAVNVAMHAAKSVSSSTSMASVIIGGGWNENPGAPWSSQRSLVYSPYHIGARAFSHYHGRSATIMADQTARFWRTAQYYDTDYWGYRNYYRASHEINEGGVIDNVSAVLSGGTFFAWQRDDGHIGGFGNHSNFRNAPRRMTGMKTWCAGHDHAVALLAMDAPPEPQVLDLTPSRAAGSGESVRLKVRAIGQHLRYQWLFNEQPISGADTASCLIVGFDTTKAGTYRVRISDGFTTVTSDACNLSLGTSPVLTQAPARRLGLRVGERLELRASLENASGCRFEWRRNGVVLEGEHASALVREAVGLGDAGRYTLRVISANGATTLTTSHVFVLPVSGTRILHEWDSEYPLADPKPWRSIDDAVDFLPGGLALRLDGRVTGWGNPYATDQATSTWLAEQEDIVALTHWGLLSANGRLAIRPSNRSSVPNEALELNNIVALAASPDAVVLEDGRVGLFEAGVVNGVSTRVIRWLSDLGNLADIQTIRVSTTPERSIQTGYFGETVLVAAGVDGTLVCSSPSGFISFSELPDVRSVLADRKGGVSVVDADGEVYAASIFGRTREGDATLAELSQSETDQEGRVELLANGKVRAWKFVWNGNTRTETERSGYPAWARDNLLVRLDSGRIMALRSADSLVRVSITPSRKVFAPDQTIVLEAEVSGTGELDLVWEQNGGIVRGATSSRLELPAGDPRNHGWYRLRATDADGNFAEAIAYVMVGPPEAWDVNRSRDGIGIRADGSVKMWNTSTGESYGIVPASVRNVVAVTKAGTALDASGLLTQWDPFTGKVVRQITDVLWIRAGDRSEGFAILRNGTVRSLKDGSLMFGNQSWHRETVDIKESQVGRNFLRAITRRDGSVAIAPEYFSFGATVRFLSLEELGGAVVASRVSFYKGAEFLVETSEGEFQAVNAQGARQPTNVEDFFAFR